MNANKGNQNSHCLFIYKDPIYQDPKSKTNGFLDELCFYPCLWPQAARSDFRDYSPELPLNQLWCLMAITRIHTGSDSYQHINEKPQKVNSI